MQKKYLVRLIVLFYSLWQITLLLLYSVSETRNRLVILLRRIYGSCSIRNTRLPSVPNSFSGKGFCEIDEHEIGYIALHVHAAIEDQKVSQAMQLTRAVRDCISLVEKQTGDHHWT